MQVLKSQQMLAWALKKKKEKKELLKDTDVTSGSLLRHQILASVELKAMWGRPVAV